MPGARRDQEVLPASEEVREPSARQRLGGALWLLADLTQADADRRSFQARAYRRAVWALDELSPGLTEPHARLLEVPGIGPGVVALIDELRNTGSLRRLDALLKRYPREANRLRRLPRMTTSRLRLLKGELGIDTTDDLLEAIATGTVERIAGIGPGSATRWRAILEMRPTPAARPIHQAAPFAAAIAGHLETHVVGTRVDVAGSIRRYDEWIERIDLVVDGGRPGEAHAFLAASAIVTGTQGGTHEAINVDTHAGITVVAHAAAPGSAGACLVWATGPGQHLAAVMSEARKNGIPAGPHAPFATEDDLYAAVGVRSVPAPAHAGRVQRAGGPRDTHLVVPGDLRGDLHLHTARSPDGRQSLEELVIAARRLGYEYVAVTDHAVGLRLGGLDADALAAQRAEVRRAREAHPGISVLHGAELNIGPDGTLDYDDATLAALDLGVAGVHSHFTLDRAAQTRRVVRAMEHPKVKVIAHLTGRRIGIRPPIDVDLEAVSAAAVRTGTALEVNGHLDRLDLSADGIRQAVERGVLLAANSDAHRLPEMGNAANAVGIMQRAGVPPEIVVNTWPVERFLDWVTR